MIAKHTLGPWHAAKNSLNHGIYDAHGNKVAVVRGSSAPQLDQRHAADARLIAAAPDMLAALQDCREALRRAGAVGELAVVDAAIAKATGAQ